MHRAPTRATVARVGAFETAPFFVRLHNGWSWGSGQSLALLVRIPLEGGAPAIRITYAGRKLVERIDASAL